MFHSKHMKNQTEKTVSSASSSSSLDHSPKTRRSKSREVSSRFLSPATTTTTTETGGISSPNQLLSPVGRKMITSTQGAGLWPSSSISSSHHQSLSKKLAGSLADHLGNDRLKNFLDRTKDKDKKSSSSNNINIGPPPPFLNRQRSCSEFSRFEMEKDPRSKENHRPSIAGKFRFPGKTFSSTKSSTSSSSSSSSLLPGRLSVDENSLSRRRSYRRHSDVFFDALSSESGSTDIFTPGINGKNSSFSSASSYLTSTASSRKSGIQVSSRYLHDQFTRTHRNSTTSSDSNIQGTTTSSSTSENSLNSTTQKNVMKRPNSPMGYGSASTQWALSPGRSGSPPISVENKGKPIGSSFSTLKPPGSPSRSKGVGNLLSFGLELFKSKKSFTSSSPLGQGIFGENAHQLRLLHNRLLQWRYVNARSDVLNVDMLAQAKSSLINAWASLSNLQSSVVQKRIQFEKEKLELKLNAILHYQIKPLEAWGDIEMQHLSAISMTKDCLHSVVCKVPLIEGAKMVPQSASMAVRHSTDLTASIKTSLSNFTPTAEKMSSLLYELAEVVSREKLLLEECFELVGMVSALEMQERSMKCNIVQMKIMQQQQLHKQPRQQEARVLA